MAFVTTSRTRPPSIWQGIGLALCGTLLITLGAKVQIPFWPVPMTLHTLSVFLVAVALGPRLGVAAMAAYLGAGAIGLPVFSGTPARGIGIAYIVGPTGGYLLGYLIASGLVGWLAAGRGWTGQVLSMLAGLAVVYVAGLAWLALFVPAPKLLAAGLSPFLLGDVVKVLLVATLVSGLSLLKGRTQ